MKFDTATIAEFVDDSRHPLPWQNVRLTKREYFAGAALTGLMAADWTRDLCPREVASLAQEHADALIRALAPPCPVDGGPTP